MSREPENLVLTLLREVGANQDAHSQRFESIDNRLRHIEDQVDDLSKLVTYSLGQSTETQFRQSNQQAQIGELFEKLEKLLSEPSDR
jgi:hypothetical protein